MLTNEELRLLKLKRRRLIILLVVTVALLPAGYFAARPASNAIKSWQARRHAQKAFAFLEKQDWDNARAEAVAAYQLRPTEPEALRALARLLSNTRHPQALEFWAQLRKQEQLLTRDDLRAEAAAALALGETARASLGVKSLLAWPDAGSPDWFLAAQLNLQAGERNQAQTYLQKILGAPASNGREQLQAAVAQLAIETEDNAASAQRRAVALERLGQLSREQDEVALNALVILAQRALTGGTAAAPSETAASATEGVPPRTDLSTGETAPAQSAIADPKAEIAPESLIPAIENHPLAKAPQKLLAVDLKIRQSPNERDALIEAAIAQWKEADPASLATLATWLNGRGEFERELATVPLERALQSRDLFLQHVDALGALGRWQEIKGLLGTERFPLDPVIQHMYLARCSAQLGEKVGAENNWRRALEAAGGDLQKLLPLADYAEKNGALEIAGAAYEAIVATAPKLRLAQQGRLRLAQTAKDTKRMHAILAEMLKFWPNDTAIQNDEAYLRTLLLVNVEGTGAVPSHSGSNKPAATPDVPPIDPDTELIAIEKLAENLVEREPSSLPHRTLLALARLCQGRPVAALEVYPGIQVAPNALTPSALAVHAAVLSANGRGDDARHEIAQIPIDRLLPEEQSVTATLRD